MGNVKALVVGVSDYSYLCMPNLEFCKNDVIEVRNALEKGLNVLRKDIFLCGRMGNVQRSDLSKAIANLHSEVQPEDTFIFYFSGHGKVEGGYHNLVVSDDSIRTRSIISSLDNIRAKSKIVILDCCFAGEVGIDNIVALKTDETIEEFFGKGYAVISSCGSSQESSQYPCKEISLFTYFLCQALTMNCLIRKGRKSLFDIWKLIFMLQENWNKTHKDDVQNPLFKAKMGGTVYFNVQEYHPFEQKKYYKDFDNFTIFSVEPIHSNVKRYRVQVLLKAPMPLDEIAVVNQQVISQVKYLNICNTKQQECRWLFHPARIIYCFFVFDMDDLSGPNYYCQSIWVDDTQDKNKWYWTGKETEIMNGICFKVSPQYFSHKEYLASHTTTAEILVPQTKAIISEMVTLAESFIERYNEFLSTSQSEDVFREIIQNTILRIHQLYFAESNLDVPPPEIKEWSQCCTCLAATIDDFALYYGNNTFAKRTPENRKACIEMTIKRYYEDLAKLRDAEKVLARVETKS